VSESVEQAAPRKQRIHTVTLTERELRTVLHAMDIARDQTVNDGWRWWHTTRYADALYLRLRDFGV
jgi:hypothetical protein